MASDAATDWICPHFYSGGPWTGQVWVMNPNTEHAKLTISFHEQVGPEVHKETDTLNPSETMWYQPWDHWGDMWVRVHSDKAVLPAGYFATAPKDDQYVEATFYRVEGLHVKLPTPGSSKARQPNQRTAARRVPPPAPD
jgi:hypothetical protein